MATLLNPLKIVLPALLLGLPAGCLPSPDRTPTTVRRASDVKISVEGTKVRAPDAIAPEAEEIDIPAKEVERPAPMDEPAGSNGAETDAANNAGGEGNPDPAAKSTGGPATFVGRVVVKGTLPSLPLPPLVRQGQNVKDAACAKEEVANESVLLSSDGGLANVFVYMKRAPREGVPEPEESASEVDQKGCIFIPHAQVVRVGQDVHLKNSDPLAHNVRINGFSNTFNQTVPAGDQEGIEYQFRSQENLPASMACDFHGWMSGWILPLNHPWGTVTDREGNFVIENLPDGEWDFIVWHEKHGYIDRSFSVTAERGKVIEHQFEADAARLQ